MDGLNDIEVQIIQAMSECDMKVQAVADRLHYSRQAIDHINRQKAEIERLQKHNTEMAHKHYNDGIKEFAERLKEQFSTENHTDWVSNLYFPKWMAQIDNLVKKMTEETP